MICQWAYAKNGAITKIDRFWTATEYCKPVGIFLQDNSEDDDSYELADQFWKISWIDNGESKEIYVSEWETKNRAISTLAWIWHFQVGNVVYYIFLEETHFSKGETKKRKLELKSGFGLFK